jgi:hypothetical protein
VVLELMQDCLLPLERHSSRGHSPPRQLAIVATTLDVLDQQCGTVQPVPHEFGYEA